MTSVARIDDFPKSSQNINFKSNHFNYDATSSSSWTWQGHYEYSMNVINIEYDALMNIIIKSLVNLRYRIVHVNENDGVIIGERGIQLNEWKTISGVYIKTNSDTFDLKILSVISQDFTGGWIEDRAKIIGEKIQYFILNNH